MNILNIFKTHTETRDLGIWGEKQAAAYLKKHGYRILKTGFIAADAEIDIVAQKKDTVAFVEVKTRRGEPSITVARPAAAVTPEKQAKILRASMFFPVEQGKRRRYDVIEVYAYPTSDFTVKEIRHLEGTFDKDTACYRR